MRSVYFVPGFAGTVLSRGPAGDDVVWIDTTALLFGRVRELALDADGVSPLPPNGRFLFPQGPLADYYGAAVELLRVQLAFDGYEVRTHGWDWRKKTRGAGEALAARIRFEATPATPATIVGHSHGGLVARAAWASLVATSETNLVRRIITLGTPHAGSYNAVAVIGAYDPSVTKLSQVSLIGGGLALASGLPNPFLPMDNREVAAIAATWPGIYDLLPALSPFAIAIDPLRPLLYDAANWRDNTWVQQAWLTYARDEWQAFLRTTASVPPSNVFTCVSSTGFPTAYKLEQVIRFGLPGTMTLTSEADSLVTVGSARVDGCRIATTIGIHSSLATDLTNSGELRELILEEGTVPPPAPEDVNLGAGAVTMWQVPPFRNGFGSKEDC